MPFPQSSEYDDAIQNPSTAFLDPELRGGVNDGPLSFGMPGPVASGNFAVVYRLKCGKKLYAVKCFTRKPPPDQAQRFVGINQHLKSSRLDCATAFEFLQQGVRVAGGVYPILKMEWLEAPTLLSFISKNYHDRSAFRDLSDSFYGIISELRKFKIAHGDLQHGNLLVLGKKLKLIDYDGMCVPQTRGLPSEEDGLPHYQHPARRGGVLSENFDNFPSLVIWCSLYALSLDPSLWIRHVKDEERMLFHKGDFLNPKASLIFRELSSLGDQRLTAAIEALRRSCGLGNLEDIPPLTEILEKNVVASPAVEWWKDEQAKPMPKNPATVPDWMSPNTDSIALNKIAFQGTFFWERGLLCGEFFALASSGVGVAYASISLFVFVTLNFILFVLVGGVIFGRFLDSDEYDGRRRAQRRFAAAREASDSFSGNDREDDFDRIVEEKSKSINGLLQDLSSLRSQCAAEELQCDNELLTSLKAIASELDRLSAKERQQLRLLSEEKSAAARIATDRIAKINMDFNSKKSNLSRQRANLASEQAKRIEVELRYLVSEFVDSELKMHSIFSSGISLPSACVASLRSNGFNCAADFGTPVVKVLSGSRTGAPCLVKKNGTCVSVAGIGPVRADAIRAWRDDLERRIRRRAPSSLPPTIVRSVQVAFEKKRGQLDVEIKEAEQEAERQRKLVQDDLNKKVEGFPAKEASVANEISVERDRLRKKEKETQQTFDLKKKATIARFSRDISRMDSVVAPAQHGLDRLRCQQKAKRDAKNAERAKLARAVQSAMRELERYEHVTFSRFFGRILGQV